MIISVPIITKAQTETPTEPVCFFETCFDPSDKAARSYYRTLCDEDAELSGYVAGVLRPYNSHVDESLSCSFGGICPKTGGVIHVCIGQGRPKVVQ